MPVVDARVEAGSSLIAPQRRRPVFHDVGKGAVEELKEFVPLVGVVQPCLHASEANSIMDDMLEGNAILT